MYNSEWLNKKDIISFEDGNCGYTLNLSNDFDKNYYIPMPISKILEKPPFLRLGNSSNALGPK